MQPKVIQGFATGDPQLRRYQVDVGDLFGDGVFHLDAGVHFDEDMLAAFVEQELHSPGAAVSDVAGESHRVGTDPLAQLGIQVRGRGQFDDLLVAPLDTAVALVEVNHIGVGVGEDLHLDMTWVEYRLLEEHPGIAEGGVRFPAGRLGRRPQVTGVGDPAHTPSSAAGDGFDEQREGHLLGCGDDVLDRFRWLRGAEHRQSGLACGVHCPGFVAGELKYVGRRAHEGDPGRRACGGEFGVLRKEPVAGVDRVGTATHGCTDDGVDRQVGAHGVARFADLIGLVSLGTVQRVAVLVGVHGGGGDAEFVGRPERPDRDLSAVGDEQLGDHALPFLFAQAAHRYQPRVASRCGTGMSATLMPTIASPRPRETLASMSGSS